MLSQKEIHSSVSKNQIIDRRVFLLAAAKIVLFGGMTYRLFNLQISDREKYLFLSDKNRLREWKTPPQRGIITDYFHQVVIMVQHKMGFILDSILIHHEIIL